MIKEAHMKIESRGKYPGVKVHLDPDEAELFLKVAAAKEPPQTLSQQSFKFAIKLGGKIQSLLKEHPNMLVERTEEEIAAALERDKQKILKQQAAMKHGANWKAVD
jgi:hypothetical protein